ncbi:hypothetical protein SBA1_950004 [Candidatus Sulfotelmatobacter kueseliae]|uniref:Uncharacterized protein n=1 Tax=Candidatus Sulfotelmatobacter kueseliae TaxID=2042962 RepID=A0A2U3LD41_9BACT|nr:hypothetical protein SBA1_950004 [Candidatus Sulfotelmatobacter kueseliae]
MKRPTTKAQLAARIRAYAGQLRRNGTQNPPTASPLAHRALETDYALVPEDALITEAKIVLRNARLTTFAVTTKAEAVAVILGIRGKRGRYVHPM